MALNIIDISFQTCYNSQLDAINGLPKPEQVEGSVLLVMDAPQAIYIYHSGQWVLWSEGIESLLLMLDNDGDNLLDNSGGQLEEN